MGKMGGKSTNKCWEIHEKSIRKMMESPSKSSIEVHQKLGFHRNSEASVTPENTGC